MKTKDIVNIAMFATLLAVCAWIYIPMTIPFTMQTFAVFLAMFVLGGKKGTLVISIYLFLGLIGMPVFSGGTAGPGVVLGPTGGYMLGWLVIGLIVWFADNLSERLAETASESFTGSKKRLQVAAMIAGLIICYGFGTLWYIFIYGNGEMQTKITTILSVCVIPFVIPDLVKLLLAYTISKKVKKIIPDV